MRIHSLRQTSKLYKDMNEVWDYFATPDNLNALTPPDVKIRVLSEVTGKKTYPGMIIYYKIRPLFNIPVRWTTVITHCVDKSYFIDEQRFGPYSLWHHEHRFVQKEGYVEMTDIVHYALPFRFLGSIAHSLLVRKKLEAIFEFRRQKVDELFGR